MEKLLRRTRETGAQVVIMDLSEVAVMDTDVSKRLLDLGIDLGSVETHHDLSSVLNSALEAIGLEINKEDGEIQ